MKRVRKTKNVNLDTIAEEALLDTRICDLPLAIPGTWLEECVQQLREELDAKGIVFKPTFYLTDEWLTPENEPVVGIPFYLAHPALISLEKKMMLEAEGETRRWCMQLLRHETGHAISYAYRLQKRKKWQQLFGSPSQEYPETYRARPYSRNYVRHLDGFYAQYHPDEDFVETFAVWLTPGLEWNKQYQEWKALKKLMYVDDLMNDIKGKAPLVKRGHQYWRLSTLKITLRNFYKKKRQLRQEDFPDFHDGNLKRIFIEYNPEEKGCSPAAAVLKSYHRNILNEVAVWTGEKKYVVNDVLKTIQKRCRELNLLARDPESIILMRTTTYVTSLIMNYLYTGWYRGDIKKRKRR